MTPVRIPAAVLEHARAVTQVVSVHTGIPIAADELLGGRAALLGLQAAGRVSAGGATRLMAGPDGWCALTLSRPDDVDAVAALLETADVPPDHWTAIEQRVRASGVEPFAERARLLGLPVGVLGETRPAAPAIRQLGPRVPPSPPAGLLVADLSAMWAGPLCGHLLARAGATVVKVESAARPDGTRKGSEAFFDWMNSGKLSYQADFAHTDVLRRLLAAADVVIESSRPRALCRRGLGPSDVPARAGRIWVRITGHGTAGHQADWVAFGDDAAVSGGLVSGTSAAPEFCGDAIADPLTGIHAARAVVDSRARGGGELIDVSMAAVAAQYAQLPRSRETACTTTPSTTGRAAALGHDNDRVDHLVAQRLAAAC
jgi:CoA-transferase family III